MHTESTLTPDAPRVIVADSRSFVRGCLVSWLNKFDRDLHPVATADAVKTLAEPAAFPPQAVILSASPGAAGNAWLNEQAAGVRAALREVPIVVVIDDSASAAGEELALSANVQGVIPMSLSPEIAAAVLHLVIAGGCYFAHLAVADAKRPTTYAPARAPRLTGVPELTPREQAVCEWLSEGLPNKVIARRLGIALSTVKIHVHHILEKLAVQNRTEVAIRLTTVSAAIPAKAANEPAARQAVTQLVV